jgi:hypothetical protein
LFYGEYNGHVNTPAFRKFIKIYWYILPTPSPLKNREGKKDKQEMSVTQQYYLKIDNRASEYCVREP